jgi:hypothetical protein
MGDFAMGGEDEREELGDGFIDVRGSSKTAECVSSPTPTSGRSARVSGTKFPGTSGWKDTSPSPAPVEFPSSSLLNPSLICKYSTPSRTGMIVQHSRDKEMYLMISWERERTKSTGREYRSS